MSDMKHCDENLDEKVFDEIKYNEIPREKIYPEFKNLFGKAIGIVVLECLLIYFFVLPIMAYITNSKSTLHGLWVLEKMMWSLDDGAINLFLVQIGISAIIMFFLSFFIASYIWSYCIFKHGIASQLRNGKKFTSLIEKAGLKLFKNFLLSILVLSILSGLIWMTFIPAALGISLFIFAFVANAYFNMELIRLGTPALANKIIDMVARYKQRNI